jgi:hypothetical protein
VVDILGILFGVLHKNRNCIIWDNMDGTEDHYVKQNNSGTKKTSTTWFHFIWNLKKVEVGWWLPEAEENSKEGKLGSG